MSTKIQTTKEHYAQQTVGALQSALAVKNVMAVPRMQKVVINVGIGKIAKESDRIEEVQKALRDITGQEPAFRAAKKSIASFKLREGQNVGLVVTLRGQRMWDFLDRLIHVALPRTRDFQGIKTSAIDAGGNLNIGIREHTIFPEIVAEHVRHLFGLQVTIVSSATSREAGEALYREMGFPLQKNDK